nr:LysE family translocator [uncultured Gellertiella sp.]
MMEIQTIFTFSLAFFVFAASPGPDNLTILSKTVSSGPAQGIAYGIGVVCSIFLFVIFTAIGFNALARYMNENLRFIQYVGALYLVYSGVMMWRSKSDIKPRVMRGGIVRLLLTGFLLNISNPKMPIFYLALLPGILGIRPLTLADTIELLTIITLVEVIAIGAHVYVGHRAKSALADPKKIGALNRGAGALMIGAGVLVASR